jgi:hypothetical protein
MSKVKVMLRLTVGQSVSQSVIQSVIQSFSRSVLISNPFKGLKPDFKIDRRHRSQERDGGQGWHLAMGPPRRGGEGR